MRAATSGIASMAKVKGDQVMLIIQGSTGVAAVSLAVVGSGLNKTVLSDADGNYEFGVPHGWTGTVTATKTGYTMSAAKTYTAITESYLDEDFEATAITYTISGNAGVAGVTLTYTDGTEKTVETTTGGAYTLTVSYNWSGTVVPTLDGYTFDPTQTIYSNVMANQTDQDYVATSTVPSYLLQDLFTTSRAVGEVNGTSSEPGPGTRVVIDTTSKLTIASEALQLAPNGTTLGNPGYWSSEQIARTAGRMLIAEAATGADEGFRIGWFTSQSGFPTGPSFTINNFQLNVSDSGSFSFIGPAVATGRPVKCAIILREAGSFIFVKDGAVTHPTWDLVFVSQGSSDANYYAGVVTRKIGSVCNQLAVVEDLYVMSPIVSDSFDRADAVSLGNSDGSGAAETGGDGFLWTDQVGTWGIDTNKAKSSALSGGVAIATVNTTNVNTHLQITPTINGGVVGLIAWWTDINNHIRLEHNGTNVTLKKVVAGTETTLLTTAKALGTTIELTTRGNLVELFSNGSIYDGYHIYVNNVTPTAICGLYTTDITNTFENFIAWENMNYDFDEYFDDGNEIPSLFGTGDSKATKGIHQLAESLYTENGTFYLRYPYLNNGYKVTDYITNIDSILQYIPSTMTYVLLQLGTNDATTTLPAEATWKANYRTVIEALHARCPSAKIGLTRPVLLQATPPSSPVANVATLKTWIDAVCAEYAYCFLGPDETDLEGGDSYVTNFADIAHESAAGEVAIAALWKTAIDAL